MVDLQSCKKFKLLTKYKRWHLKIFGIQKENVRHKIENRFWQNFSDFVWQIYLDGLVLYDDSVSQVNLWFCKLCNVYYFMF